MIYLAQVLAELQDFRSSVPTYLVGGMVDRGFSNNDVDILRSKYAYAKPSLSRLHLIDPEELSHPLASPLLPIGGRLLWDFADDAHYETDEFLAQSTAYWTTQLQAALRGKEVVDVGCGDGFGLKCLAAAGAHPIGISTCSRDIEVCRFKGFEAYLMDQNLLEFDDESFDIVWSHHTLEHSIAPVLAIREAYRVLKPGGQDSSSGIFDLSVGTGKAPGHHYRFDAQTLLNLLVDGGFHAKSYYKTRFGFSPEIHIRAIKQVQGDSHGRPSLCEG